MDRRLSHDERQLWSRVARTVRAAPGKRIEVIAEQETPAASRTRVQPGAKATKSAARSIPHKPTPPEDLSGQRRIRRGQHEIEARLDLHGHTQDTAHREVVEFILRQAGLGARCVLVITGKGRLGSGILRSRLFDWIGDPDLRPFIAGYASAHPRHGGAGATYLFLRSAKR